MAQDREFYKKAYKDTWDAGNRRELIVQSLLESWGFEVEYTGFMAMSNKYTPDSPEEKSVPDFTIHNNLGKKIWIEVKQFHSNRITRQMSSVDNVIAAQGRIAVQYLADLIRSW